MSSPGPSERAASSSKSSSGQTSSTSVDSVEEMEQEDSVSTSTEAQSSSGHLTVQAALTAFRDQWHKEITRDSKPKAQLNEDGNDKESEDADDIEDNARSFYMEGAENEQKGLLYEAIRFYKKAVQLVPDIEFKIYNSTRGFQKDQKDQVSSVATTREPQSEEEDDDDDDDDDAWEDPSIELLPRLQRWLTQAHTLCRPGHPQRGTHISSLPMEILLYIFQWVVSYDLDIRSLEMCGLVSRGFYICSRDSEIWRLVCQRIWGTNCGGLSNHLTWREMYLARPHLNFLGCYISTTSYKRNGENTFQDRFYRPLQQVDYFRYLRFFPEGKVLMLTTAEGPIPVLGYLKSRNPKNPAVLLGNYRLNDDKVIIVLRRNEKATAFNNNLLGRVRRPNVEINEHTFHMELRIKHCKGQKNGELVWTRYTVFCRRETSETSTNYEILDEKKFRPFYFSRVKSYGADSERPLL